MNTLICLSYHFPPFGGVAVQRLLRFARHLPRHGWQPHVICAHPPAYSSTPLDPSLLDDLSGDLRVERLRVLEPERFCNDWSRPPQKVLRNLFKTFDFTLVPDDQALWILPAALRAARRARQLGARLLWATGPPFSTLVAGSWASRWSGVPLVADFRDDWTGLGADYRRNQGWRQRRELAQEQSVLRQAKMVLTVTPGLVDRLRARSPFPERVRLLPNGFEPSHFQAPATGPRAFFYAGSLYAQRNPAALLQAYAAFRSAWGGNGAPPELHFAGRYSPELRPLFEPCPEGVRHLGFLSHRDTCQRMTSALANVLLVDDTLPDIVYSGKLLEYLGAGRPVLALTPLDSPVAQLMGEGRLGEVAPGNDVERLLSSLRRLAEGPRQEPQTAVVQRFNVEHQVAELAGWLEEVSP